MASFRSKNGTRRPPGDAECDGRSPMSKAFSEAKERRKGRTDNKRQNDGERKATDGWNEEEHDAFM